MSFKPENLPPKITQTPGLIPPKREKKKEGRRVFPTREIVNETISPEKSATQTPVKIELPKVKPAANLGWGVQLLSWVGAKVLGSPDDNDISVDVHRNSLAFYIGNHELNDVIHKMAKTLMDRATETKGGWFEGVISTERPLFQNIIEVNILHALINLARKVKENKPDANLSEDEFFTEILNMVAQETNTEMKTINDKINAIDIEGKRRIQDAEDHPSIFGKSRAAIQADINIRKTEQMASISNKILSLAFPNGKNDIIVPTSKKGWVDLPRWTYMLLERQLPNLILGFTEKLNMTTQVHEQNIKKINTFKQGDKIIELGEVLTGQLGRLINYLVNSKKKLEAEQIGPGKDIELNKLVDSLGNYSKLIVMHILAHVGESYSVDKQHILTTIIQNMLSEVIQYSEDNGQVLKNAFGEYHQKIDEINKKFPTNNLEKQQAIAEAAATIKKNLNPLTQEILKKIGIDNEGLKEVLPTQFKGLLGYVVKKETLPNYMSDLFGGFVTDFAFEVCKDVIYPQREEPTGKNRLKDYDVTVKALDALVTELIPTIDLSLADSSSDIGQILMESINELLLGKHADAKFFEEPIKEIVHSDLMPKVDAFAQNYIKRTLVGLLANLANTNSDFENFEKVDMLPAALLNIIKICQEQVENYDELMGQITAWNIEMGLCDKMPQSTEDEQDAKNNKLKELGVKKGKIRELFQPSANEILNRGGWDDPQNILMPDMMKPKFKNMISNTLLPEMLFRIYSDTFVIKSLTNEEKIGVWVNDPEKIDLMAKGIIKKTMPAIKGSLADFSYLFADKMNQKMAKSSLNPHEEAVFGSQLQQTFTAQNSTTERMWNGLQDLLSSLTSMAISRLSLAYRGEDRGNSLSNAIRQVGVLMDEQNIDPAVIEKIHQYRNKTKEIKVKDQLLSKLKEEALNADPSAEGYPLLLDDIKQLTSERRKKFVKLHLDEYLSQKDEVLLSKQMTLVREILDADTHADTHIEKLEAGAPELLKELEYYRSLMRSEIDLLGFNIDILKKQLNGANEDTQRIIKSQIADSQRLLIIKERANEKNDLLKLKIDFSAEPLTPNRLLEAFKNYEEEKIRELEQMPPLQTEYEELLNQFKPLSKQLLNDMGFKEPKDLPVPFFLQGTIWQTLQEGVLPDMMLDMYYEVKSPRDNLPASKTQLREAIAKENGIKLEEVDEIAETIENGFSAIGVKIKETVETKLQDGNNIGLTIHKALEGEQGALDKDLEGEQGALDEDTVDWYADVIDDLAYSPQIKKIVADLPEIVQAVILRKLVQLAKAEGVPLKSLPAKIIGAFLDGINEHRVHLKAVVDAAYRENPNVTEEQLQEKLKKQSLKVVDRLFDAVQIDPSQDFLLLTRTIWNSMGKDVLADLFAKTYLDTTKVYRQVVVNQLKQVIAEEKGLNPTEAANLGQNIKLAFGAFGGMIRDAAKKQLGLMPDVNEKIVGLKDGKVVMTEGRNDQLKAARHGEWALRESKSSPGKFVLILKQKGKTRTESPIIPLDSLNPEEMHQAIAQYKSYEFANNIAGNLVDKMGASKSDAAGTMKNWIAGSVDETLRSNQIQQVMSDIPDMVEAIVLKKLVQLAQVNDMPIKPKEGESALKYLPANIVITLLNGIETHRRDLKNAVKEALIANPDRTLTSEELQVAIKPTALKVVENIFDQLKFKPQEDLPVPYAEELWNMAGKDAVADMFAKVYVDMSKNLRVKEKHIASLDTRFKGRTEKGHTRLVEATKGFTDFAMKYIKNMMVFNTPGLEGGLDAVDSILRSQGDQGQEAAYYIQSNREAIKHWFVDNNLKEIAKSGARGVEGALFPAAKGDIRSIMLKIFDNFTGNIEKLENQNPERTFQFVLKLMGLMAQHLQTVNDITKMQQKTHMFEADPVLMEKEFADRGKLHDDMPGYQLRKAILQTQAELQQVEKELQGLRGKVQTDEISADIKKAEYKLQAVKINLEALKNEAETKLKNGTYKKMTSYFLEMAGYRGPKDLTEVPPETQEMLWDALNNSLGPEIFQSIFGNALETNMLNSYVMKLLQTVNDKIGKVMKEDVSNENVDPLALPKKEAIDIPAGTPEEIAARQAQCKLLLENLGAMMPKFFLSKLTYLELVGKLTANQVESILRESMKEWSMLGIMEEALVAGAANLPKEKLPETPEEARIAKEKSDIEASKMPEQIQQEAVKYVREVRKSIWRWFKLQWKSIQTTIDNWIAKHDIGGVFSAIKKGLDKIFHTIFFDIIGTVVIAILRVPFSVYLYYLEHYKIPRFAEIARKNVVDTKIHQNLGLESLDALRDFFPPPAPA